MDRKRLMLLAREVFRLPTAPFAEDHVTRFIKAFAARRKTLTLKQDACGNLILRYKRQPTGGGALLAIGAHMDHPGMEITSRTSENMVSAVYHGRGPGEGLKGARVRIFTRDKMTKGVAAEVAEVAMAKTVTAELRLLGTAAQNRTVLPGDFTMYDFPPATLKKGLLHTRACDDPAAVVALLAALDEMNRRRIRGECIVFFTRAEETGLNGALVMAKQNALPARSKIIALENSSATGRAEIGGGPVVRVGDVISVFDPALTHFITRVAADLASEDTGFRYQRKLMDGGACEATVFSALGYQAGCICLPLGNYHNIGPDAKPHPEVIALSDLDNLVELLLACFRRRGDFNRIQRATAARFTARYSKARKALRSTLR